MEVVGQQNIRMQANTELVGSHLDGVAQGFEIGNVQADWLPVVAAVKHMVQMPGERQAG
jgi:hypothetical protein